MEKVLRLIPSPRPRPHPKVKEKGRVARVLGGKAKGKCTRLVMSKAGRKQGSKVNTRKSLMVRQVVSHLRCLCLVVACQSHANVSLTWSWRSP